MTLMIVEVEEGDRDYWDRVASTFASAHPLNAYGWGKVRQTDGWQPSYIMAKDGEIVRAMIMVLTKSLAWSGFSIMYAPKGPLCNQNDLEALKALVKFVRGEAERKKAIFLRIDPNILEDRSVGAGDPFAQEGFIHLDHRWTFWNSPRDVYRIDIGKADGEEGLFNSIDRDARRCVRKAQKESVDIRPAETIEELRRFYEIFSKFTVGKGFMCRKLQYQESLWREYVAKGNGRLFLAVYRGEIIGGLICILFGRICLAMHMGTPAEFNKLQTGYAYVWESIRWAKEKGCTRYSFRGVGTTPTQESFKRKFHPEHVALVGYYDLPFRPFLYRLFNVIEFGVLPRIWRILMQVRGGCSLLASRARRLKLAQVNLSTR